jgi:hypothetical protein
MPIVEQAARPLVKLVAVPSEGEVALIAASNDAISDSAGDGLCEPP